MRRLRQGGARTNGSTRHRVIEQLDGVLGTPIAEENSSAENKMPSGKHVTGGPNSRLVVALIAMATTSFDHLAQESIGRLAGLIYDRKPVS